MKFCQKKRVFILIIVIALLTLTFKASAENVFSPYSSYEYNCNGTTEPSPNGYMVEKVATNEKLALKIPLNSPTEMVRSKNDNYYILDSANSRIVEIDCNLIVKNIYDNFTDQNGEKIKFVGARGLAVSKDFKFYIGDTENGRILIFNSEQKLINTILRPDEALHDIDSPFRVTKILLDEDNRVFALAESINMGAMVFDKNGKFLSFYGSNPVKKTSEVLMNVLRKRFMTREQIMGLVSATPTTFTSFAFNNDGFIYTVTSDNSSTAGNGLVRLLNYEGNNILKVVPFGDTESDGEYFENSKHTDLNDVTVDDNGFINLLDVGRGKIFQYTESGQMVTVFGCYGDKVGAFSKPQAIESYKDKILVLDSGKNQIILFSPTTYGTDIRNIFLNIGPTDTDVLKENCHKILNQNSNSVIPYYGLGMMYDSKEQYSQAMDEFKITGGYKTEYSNALRQYRQIFIKSNFLWVVLISVSLLGLVIFALVKFSKNLKIIDSSGTFSRAESKYYFPFYTAFHPIDGFSQFKTRNNTSMLLSFLILISWLLVSILNFFKTGYCFNNNLPNNFNIVLTVFKTIFIFFLFVVANWSVCSLLNGKGSIKDIIAVSAYSLCPYIISLIINLILSNVLTLDEIAFINIIAFIGIFWSAIELVFGMYAIHQYSFSKTLFSLILTFVGMAIIIFIIVIFYSLLQQTYSFIKSISEELSLR